MRHSFYIAIVLVILLYNVFPVEKAKQVPIVVETLKHLNTTNPYNLDNTQCMEAKNSCPYPLWFVTQYKFALTDDIKLDYQRANAQWPERQFLINYLALLHRPDAELIDIVCPEYVKRSAWAGLQRIAQVALDNNLVAAAERAMLCIQQVNSDMITEKWLISQLFFRLGEIKETGVQYNQAIDYYNQSNIWAENNWELPIGRIAMIWFAAGDFENSIKLLERQSKLATYPPTIARLHGRRATLFNMNNEYGCELNAYADALATLEIPWDYTEIQMEDVQFLLEQFNTQLNSLKDNHGLIECVPFSKTPN